MKSKTKCLLSRDEIERLVRLHFGESCKVGTVEELKGGMFNSAYLIERINEKDKIVLKVSVSPESPTLTYEKDPMPTEVAVYKMVSEQTNIPTPTVLAVDFSKQHISSNYFFMTALEGEPMNQIMKKIDKNNHDSIKKELAFYFSQLHQIRGNYFGYFTNDSKHQFTSWKDAYLHMMKMILEDGKIHKVKLPYKKIEKILNEKTVYLEDIKKPILVDFDLWTGNIFLKKEGDKYVIEGIIDFERAFWGDPYADFSTTFLFDKDLRKDDLFWREYQDRIGGNRDLTKEDLLRIELYKLYILTIMMVETYRYSFLVGFIQKSLSRIFMKKSLKKLEK